MDLAVPHLNPEITWGSVGIMITMIFSFGGVYMSFSNKILSNEKAILDMRTDLKETVAAIDKAHTESITTLRDTQKEIAKDLRVHITAVGEQHIQIMGIFADMKMTLAMTTKDVEALGKSQETLSYQVRQLSDRQAEYLRVNLGPK